MTLVGGISRTLSARICQLIFRRAVKEVRPVRRLRPRRNLLKVVIAVGAGPNVVTILVLRSLLDM